jgi:uncharacterized repeat protein (TIGR01451 family)
MLATWGLVLVGFGIPEDTLLAQAPAPLQPGGVRAAEPPPKPSATDSRTSASVAPALQLEKVAPSALNVGQVLRYEIVLRNAGPAAVAGVRLEEQLPAGARFVKAEPAAEQTGDRLGWNVGSLEPGGERRFQIEVQPAAEGELHATTTVTASASVQVHTKITRPKLALKKTGPETAQINDTVPFRIEVSNTGTGPATNVVLHDELPAGLKHAQGAVIETDLGTLAPGETRNITLEATAVQEGHQLNRAIVTADGGLEAKAEAAVQVTRAGLQLRKSGPKDRFLNREAEYDLEVYNPGTAPATDVRVIDLLPEGLDFISASDGGTWSPNTRQVVWSLGTIAPGHRRGLSVKLLARAVGDWVNQAVARADRGLEAKAESALRVQGVPALMLEVVDLDDPVETGSETTYEIRVVNQGTCACTGLQVLATVPPQMEPRSAEGPTAHRIAGQQVQFEKLPLLAARADALFRVRVAGRQSGDVRFKVEMSCDQLTMPVHEEESTHIYSDQDHR